MEGIFIPLTDGIMIKEPINIICDLTEKKKLMISISTPKNWFCDYCRNLDHEKKKSEYPARSVNYVLYKNFLYSCKYPNKKTYEERIVPLIYNHWQFISGGYIVLCETCEKDDPYFDYSMLKCFWEFHGNGYDYIRNMEPYVTKNLLNIYEKVKNSIKDLKNEEAIEVERDWVEQPK